MRVRAGQEEQVGVPVVGADLAQVRVTGRVDGLHGLGLQERLERGLGLGAAVDPECVADAVPGLGEAFLVGVGVLDDLPLQPVRVPGDEAVADRSAVVLHVDAHRAGEADLVQEPVDDLGEVVERVVPGRRVGHVGVAEARVVRRQDVEAVGQRRHEVAELVRRGREAAEQQQLRVRRVARLAVEDVETLDLGGVESGHVLLHSFCDRFRSR